MTDFWTGVKKEALAGIAVLAFGSAIAGIAYLIHTVPRKLDEVLGNQAAITQRMKDTEKHVDDLRLRVLKLELK